MAASANLSVARLDIVPGGRKSLTITVRNTGSVVDEFSLEVLGRASQWATVTPAVIPLFPGAEGTAEITFVLPQDSSVQTGEIDVAVKVNSKEDPDGSTVEEAVLAVGAFVDAFAELVPRTTQGSRRGLTELALDNHGNARLDASITAADPDNALKFEVDPPGIVVEPGKANFAKVRITPVKTFWRGPERTIPFKVTANTTTAEGPGVLTVDGMFIQRAKLPRWLARLLGLLALALLALLLLWQFAFKPVIRSAAREAAKADVQQAATEAAKQTAAAVTAANGTGGADPSTTGGKKPTGSGSGDASDSAGDATPAGSGGGTGGDDGRGGVSTDKRIAVEAALGGNPSSEKWEPAGEKQQFNLTDVVLQNPRGDAGLIRIKRGEAILLESALENFRDLDFHFVAPYAFKAKEPLVVEVVCANVEPSGPCKAAATLAGFIKAA
jgi:hypothetical protein